MKKFNFLRLASSVGICIVLLSACNQNPTTKDTTTNRVTINDVKWGPVVFAQDINNDNTNDTMNLIIEVLTNYSVDSMDSRLKSLKISNIEVANTHGEMKIVFPQHLDTNAYNYYYGPIDIQPKPEELKDQGNSFEYKVISGFPQFADEVDVSSGILKFKVVFLNVVKKQYKMNLVNYKEILADAGVEANSLNNTVSFDLIMNFEDGVQASKSFSVDIEGAGFLDEFYMNSNSSYQNEKF